MIIPFPVCADAAIYYKEGRRLTDRREMKINEWELKRIDKKNKESRMNKKSNNIK